MDIIQYLQQRKHRKESSDDTTITVSIDIRTFEGINIYLDAWDKVQRDQIAWVAPLPNLQDSPEE